MNLLTVAGPTGSATFKQENCQDLFQWKCRRECQDYDVKTCILAQSVSVEKVITICRENTNWVKKSNQPNKTDFNPHDLRNLRFLADTGQCVTWSPGPYTLSKLYGLRISRDSILRPESWTKQDTNSKSRLLFFLDHITFNTGRSLALVCNGQAINS